MTEIEELRRKAHSQHREMLAAVRGFISRHIAPEEFPVQDERDELHYAIEELLEKEWRKP